MPLSNMFKSITNTFSIEDTVDQNSFDASDDVINTKSALDELGHMPDPDANVSDGLQSFQKQVGEKIDGIMKPGGPTEKALSESLALKQSLPDNVTVFKPETSKRDERVWSATASFGPKEKPKSAWVPSVPLADKIKDQPSKSISASQQKPFDPVSYIAGPHGKQAIENLKELGKFIGPAADVKGMMEASAQTTQAIKNGKYIEALSHLTNMGIEVADLIVPANLSAIAARMKYNKKQPTALHTDGATPPSQGDILSNKFVGRHTPDGYKRTLEEDYPNGFETDQHGNLTHDIDGRPFNTKGRVSGLRKVQEGSRGIEKREYDQISQETIGEIPTTRQLDADTLAEVAVNKNTKLPVEIRFSDQLTKDNLDIVYGHEIGHVIDQLAGEIPTKGLNKELTEVYNTLNNPQAYGKPFTPKQAGYDKENTPREFMAETIRAYMENPDYLKTVAPKTATQIRRFVNENPRLKGIIQFNSLAGLGAVGLNKETEE